MECSDGDIVDIEGKFGVSVEALENVELTIIKSPIYAIKGDTKAVYAFLKKYMASLGVTKEYYEFVKETNDRIYVMWEKLGEVFHLSYYRGEDFFEAKKEALPKQQGKKKTTDEEEVVILKSSGAEKPRVSMDLSILLK